VRINLVLPPWFCLYSFFIVKPVMILHLSFNAIFLTNLLSAPGSAISKIDHVVPIAFEEIKGVQHMSFGDPVLWQRMKDHTINMAFNKVFPEGHVVLVSAVKRTDMTCNFEDASSNGLDLNFITIDNETSYVGNKLFALLRKHLMCDPGNAHSWETKPPELIQLGKSKCAKNKKQLVFQPVEKQTWVPVTTEEYSSV
jgi:hypothetical protein